MPRKVNREAFYTAVQEVYGNIKTLNRIQVLNVCSKKKILYPNWLVNDPAYRVSRGVYNLEASQTFVPPKKEKSRKSTGVPVAIESVPVAAAPVESMSPEMALAALTSVPTQSHISLVPEKAPGYVPFGYFSDVRQVIKSGVFYPIYITGLSGNGKTMMVEQVCAQEGRECVRVNVTAETDEDDLLGGFRLVDGKTVWQNGPVIVAMERGAILLLDEVDLGTNKLMCLQPVLEGKTIYLKKINRQVHPAKGFNILATANTKGKGSDDGRFIGTNVMNEAFLERFSVTIEQEYPPIKTEEKILTNVLSFVNIEDTDFVTKLVSWADVIRKSFYEGAVSEIISTRRLIHICQAYAIFNRNREKAITLCLNRFDIDTKTSFFDLYKKLDESMNPPVEQVHTDAPPQTVNIPQELGTTISSAPYSPSPPKLNHDQVGVQFEERS